MTTCENCRFWRKDLCNKENYGECTNKQQIDKMIHEARHTYRFNERAQYMQEQLYKPYITAKDHRCIFGEEKAE